MTAYVVMMNYGAGESQHPVRVFRTFEGAAAFRDRCEAASETIFKESQAQNSAAMRDAVEFVRAEAAMEVAVKTHPAGAEFRHYVHDAQFSVVPTPFDE